MKRVFGLFEAVFDVLYLLGASVIGVYLLATAAQGPPRLLAGVMALLLAFGDAFHLVPRIRVIFGADEERLRPALGRGKQITSVTMTFFYLLLFELGQYLFGPSPLRFAFYVLVPVRVVLCLLPQNDWTSRFPPLRWGIMRNIPFFLLGAAASIFFFMHRDIAFGLSLLWLAAALSFLFYLPVVLFANRSPKVGMLMLPKTCMYLWILAMCLTL